MNYQLIGDSIEGEEIPPRVLERLLNPSSFMANKTVCIYRDGKFVGQEAEYLSEWASYINTKLILVECRKSNVPRLYSYQDQRLDAPPSALGFEKSSTEGLLVTTEVSEKMGLSRPIRLVTHPLSQPAAFEDVLETTRRLVLLHYGSIHIPRVPPLIIGSDKMGYLQLIGIYPTRQLSGDRQFWL